MSRRINEGANVMSTSDHTSNGVEALQRFYQAESEYVQTGGEDFGPVAATLHPQIVMIQADSLPFGGQWHGREGFERWMQAFGEAWSSVSATDLRFFEHDDTVVVVAQMEATARASGQSFHAPICHVVRIRDGLLMEFRMFYWDTVATNRALARDQHFVKVMPRDFVHPRRSDDDRGTGFSCGVQARAD
jgi:ketosteroid isomerase-like protein